MLMDLKITHIINCTPENFMGTKNHFENDKQLNIKYIRIPVDDNYKNDIKKYFYLAIQFIENALKNGTNRVFVHCLAGISRSSTIVSSYLLKLQPNMTVDDAINFVKNRREKIRPNDGFKQQLIQFRKHLNDKK